MNLYIILGAFAIGTLLGWRGEVWHEAYQTKKIEDKVIVKLGEGESKIIDFNQAFDKVKTDAKDCTNQPLPSDIAKLLR